MSNTKQADLCVIQGCANTASFDPESGYYSDHCYRCSGFQGLASPVVHMHRESLGNGRMTETEVTAEHMGLRAFDESARTMAFVCGRDGLTVTYDMDEILSQMVENRQAAEYKWRKVAAEAARQPLLDLSPEAVRASLTEAVNRRQIKRLIAALPTEGIR